jgi:hypothetical protein
MEKENTFSAKDKFKILELQKQKELKFEKELREKYLNQ